MQVVRKKMIKVLNASQMGNIDRLTTVRYGIPSIDLMESAATAVYSVIDDKFNGLVSGKRAIVICGKGNNGGDGAAIARLLADAGAVVSVLIGGRVEDMRGDARTNFNRLKSLMRGTVGLVEVLTEADVRAVWERLEKEGAADLIVDAVFGTGLDRPVEGFYKEFIAAPLEFARSQANRPLLVSVDLPSGIDSDRAEPIGFSFKSDVTVTFTAPKRANVLPTACRAHGELFVKDIGSPTELIDEADSDLYVSEAVDAAEWMQSTDFSVDSYKKTRGSVLVVAGSTAFPGAAVLAGNGAMRSGAGVVTVATPASAADAIRARVLPEVMVRSVAETSNGAIAPGALTEIADLIESADTALIGSGLTSVDAATRGFVREFVSGRRMPVVIDADGLNALSPFDLQGDDENPLVLTPHQGEFLRLLGTNEKAVLADRVAAVRRFAADQKVICVLKGERTLVASTDGRIVINPTGNAGLGKAGNGDNLAGILTGFIAQSSALTADAGRPFVECVFEAVVAAVFISGLAGDIADKRFGKRVMTASDVRDCLSSAFREVANS